MPNKPRVPFPGSFMTVPGSEQARREVLFEYGAEAVEEGPGAPTTRLVTYADVSQPTSRPEDVSIPVRHVLQLADGRSVLLLSDRGFGSSGSWADQSVEIEQNARSVVGPDEPPAGRTKEEEAALHWAYLQRIAQRQGVTISADELRHLPHHVVLSDRLLARIGARSKAE